ncbi:MAG: arsenate reductase family protein [Clostridia bacterium]|nr:arsenate reductase family protein [Clostridia bacterium]
MQFICYAKCTTCQKARKWLEDHQIPFEERPIKEQNPTADELKAWQQKSGLPLRRFFNTSGMLYRELKLTERLPKMGEDEQIALLASDGMLVKRPILVNGDTVLVGFKEAEWSAALLNR